MEASNLKSLKTNSSLFLYILHADFKNRHHHYQVFLFKLGKNKGMSQLLYVKNPKRYAIWGCFCFLFLFLITKKMK